MDHLKINFSGHNIEYNDSLTPFGFHQKKSEIKNEKNKYSSIYIFYNYHYFNVEYNNIKLNDTLSFLNENYFRNDKNINGISLGYEFNRDFRDIKNYPLNGFRLNFKIRKDGIGIFKN